MEENKTYAVKKTEDIKETNILIPPENKDEDMIIIKKKAGESEKFEKKENQYIHPKSKYAKRKIDFEECFYMGE